jgi:peptide/nickel transport system permease protein
VHALRASLGPLFQVLGFTLPFLLSGALIVEVLFSWPGLGQVTYGAMVGRDYPLLLACTAWSATLVILGSLVADILQALADPRIREQVS